MFQTKANYKLTPANRLRAAIVNTVGALIAGCIQLLAIAAVVIIVLSYFAKD